MKGVMLFLFVGIFMLGVVSASEDVFFQGDVRFNLESNYLAGDELSTVFTISNGESFPIVGGALIVEIVKGCAEFTYPSQISDCDNVFYSEVIEGINLVPNSEKEIEFSYNFPKDLVSGTYRLDVYYRTERTPIVGMAHIFLPGKSKSFEVEGLGSFPYAKILRTKTEINNKTGPIGVGINLGDSVSLNLYVFSSESRSVSVKATICDWEDSLCDESLSIHEKSLLLGAGEVVAPIELEVPSKPGAYAIKLEVLEGGRLVSLYRSRLIVMGDAARIRKLYTDSYYTEDKMKLTALVGGSPDHYTNPTVEDVELEVKISDLVSGEEYLKEMNVGDLSKDNFFAKEDFSFNVNEPLYNFEVCAELSSGDVVYDNYCYVIDSSLFESNKRLITLDKDFEGKEFTGVINVKDYYTREPVVTDIFVVVKKDGEYLFSESKSGDSEFGVSFDVDRSKRYTITVQDKITNQEKVFEVGRMSSFIWVLLGLIFVIIIAIIIIIIIKRGGET